MHLGILCLLTHLMVAQPAERKVYFAGENNRVARQLQAVDRLVDPLGSVDMLPKAIGLAAPAQAFAPLVALAGCGGERNTADRWEQVLDDYQSLLELQRLQSSDDALVPGTPSRQLRWVFHERLARMPASVLRIYRQQVDADALKWLQQATHDARPLRRLVDDLFCSRWGDQALARLGDLAFERGQFDEALHWWGHLVALPNTAPLQFPEPKVDVALIHAKQTIALSFLGKDAEAQRWLAVLKRRHPEARGRLAGRDGLLADVLAEQLAAVAVRSKGRLEAPWPTFAGPALAEPLSPRLWVDGPAWTVSLPRATEMPARFGADRQPPYFPIVADDQVIVGDTQAVRAYHLVSGKLAWSYELKPAPGVEPDNRPGQAFALAASAHRVFARLGGFLACLEQGREVWTYSPKTGHLDGPPLVHDDSVCVVRMTPAVGRVQAHVVCLDSATGQLRWTTEICDGPAPDSTRGAPVLLTLAGGQLIANPHVGAVVALDPWSGQRLWGLRYPGRNPLEAGPSPRGLNCCVASLGRVFVAPADSERLYCLEASTGEIFWERAATDVVHLLGEADGLLLFTTPAGIQAVDAKTGMTAWQQPSVGRLPGLGRGLLMGRWVLWPTQDPQLPYRALLCADGEQEGEGFLHDPTQLRGLLPGNVVFGHGCLVVAGMEELACYLPSRLRMEREIKPAEKVYHRAMTHLDAGERAAAQTRLGELANFGGNWRKLAEQERNKMLPAAILPERAPRIPPPPIPHTSTGDWPFTRRWETLFAGRLLEVENDAPFILAWDDGRLACIDPGDGSARWSIAQPTLPTWARVAEGRLLVANTDEVRCLSWWDGDEIWSHRTTSGRTGQWRLREGIPVWLAGLDPADEFQRSESHLIFREGQRGWCVLHLESGAHRRQGVEAPLSQRPLAKEMGRLQMLSVDAKHIRWTFAPDWPTSLTGFPTRTFGGQELLLALVSRNYGDELERLDPATGRRVWSKPVVLREGFDPEHAVIDARACYFVHEQKAHAVSLADGKRFWSKPLPYMGDCAMLRFGSALLVLPLKPTTPAALLVLDPRDGALVQRFAVEAGTTHQRLRSGVAVAEGGRLWTISPDR